MGSATTPLLGSSYESSATARVDDLTTRTLSANVYYDFPLARSRITPMWAPDWAFPLSSCPGCIITVDTRVQALGSV